LLESSIIEAEVTFTNSIGARVRAMLGVQLASKGDFVPIGWHFPLFDADLAHGIVRPDAFPGLGIALPDNGLPRLVAGGRTVEYCAPVPMQTELRRRSIIVDVTNKGTDNAPLAFVNIAHELIHAATAQVLVREQQTFIMMAAKHVDRAAKVFEPEGALLGEVTITPTDTMLFQFSALSFNSHKIHLDRDYAAGEGFADLVVNGGLTTLLMTEFARVELGLSLAAIKVTNRMPLYVNRPITIAAYDADGAVRIVALNDQNQLAAEMEVTL
jgi:3-methylfumaryl-CoA hydratase